MFKKHDPQKLEMTLAIMVLLLVNFVVTTLPRGMISWAVSLPALAIITITGFARLRDITSVGKRWFVRRIGMILASTSALGLMLGPVIGYHSMYPSWSNVCLYWGFALAWLTTPEHPPWWKYINGESRLTMRKQG